MDLPARLAHWIANHRRTVLALALALAVASVLVLTRHARFGTDVLDLLPAHFDSVRALKQFDREFSQGRELTFAIIDETGTVDLDGFAGHFAEKLRAQPWIARVMEKSPMESADGIRDIQPLAALLLLNLEATAFSTTLASLTPATIDARLAHLRAALESGSPKAQFDLQTDPLGLVAPALAPLASSLSIEQTRPLASPDGTLRIVLALTNQEDASAPACQEMMRRVEALRAGALVSWSGEKPQVLVTGRTAFVGELSAKMHDDVISTLLTSLALVAFVFWLGFRRVRPLLAILHTLLLCCVVSVAFGALVFSELNMITIGLCAILVGLGVDFGMILHGLHQSARASGQSHEHAIGSALRHHGSGILLGALTTAAAFLCLLASECSGFVQLGVLIAFGILAAAALMITVFFALLPAGPAKTFTSAPPSLALTHPRRRTIAGGIALGALALIGFGPFAALKFDANPKSLEPRHSRAGEALRTIQRKLPAAGEPVLALIHTSDAASFHAAWEKARAHWSGLVRSGRLKSANSPAAFALSPERIATNRAALAAIHLVSSRHALATAAQREGLSAEAIQPALALLDALASPPPSLQNALPPQSPWWFVIDRFLARTAPHAGVAYLTPAQPIQVAELSRTLTVPGIDVHFTGWAWTLATLEPWAKSKLFLLSGAMLAFNALLLAFFFRRISSLAIIFCGLALGTGALLATLKLASIPLNLFNALAFPLVLGVGVDYAIYVLAAIRSADPQHELGAIFKPVLLSGLTTTAGFASLATAENPALRSLGAACAIGVVWSLVATFFFVLPAAMWRDRR